MRALACITPASSTSLGVLRPDWVHTQMSSECGVPDSPAGLELLTPDLVALRVASGDEYRPTLDDESTGGVNALLGAIRTRIPGVRLMSTASYDAEVVETGTVDTQLSLCSSPVHHW